MQWSDEWYHYDLSQITLDNSAESTIVLPPRDYRFFWNSGIHYALSLPQFGKWPSSFSCRRPYLVTLPIRLIQAALPVLFEPRLFYVIDNQNFVTTPFNYNLSAPFGPLFLLDCYVDNQERANELQGGEYAFNTITIAAVPAGSFTKFLTNNSSRIAFSVVSLVASDLFLSRVPANNGIYTALDQFSESSIHRRDYGPLVTDELFIRPQVAGVTISVTEICKISDCVTRKK